MKFVKLISVSTALFILSGCVVHVNAQRADVELQETLTLQTSNLTNFDIDAGAGSLKIVGVEGANSIEVSAEILTTEERNYTLTLTKSGSTAKLVAEHDSHSGYWKGSSPQINLTITMPNSMMLNVDDGSGDLEISKINNSVKLDDGSGDAMVEYITGDLWIDDGSGELSVRQVVGKVSIDDGSGELVIANIDGDVNVEDGSGDLSILDVSGTVTIDDGSGSINLNGAGGLKIIESGSGGLQISNVSGSVDIES